jgi:hypothetical protein
LEKIRNIRLFQENTLAGLEAELQRHLILQNVVLIDQSVLLIVSTILYIFIVNVKKKPKGQARIDNLETKGQARIDNLETKGQARIDNLETKGQARIDNLETKGQARIDNLETKGQARIDNLETLTTFGTNNRTKTNKPNNIIQKSKTMSTITQGLAKGNQYLLPIKHPSCY